MSQHAPYASAAQHARAVRKAIHTARAVNEQWTTLAHVPASPTVPAATVVPTVSTGAKASFINVSPHDVMLGLRVGTKLVVVDEANNKNSDLVRAIDALLTRAKKMVNANGRSRIALATDVEHQEGTRVSIEVIPTAKGSEVTMHYENNGTRERIQPIGVVDFYLG